jgi:hypothetical protein
VLFGVWRSGRPLFLILCNLIIIRAQERWFTPAQPADSDVCEYHRPLVLHIQVNIIIIQDDRWNPLSHPGPQTRQAGLSRDLKFHYSHPEIAQKLNGIRAVRAAPEICVSATLVWEMAEWYRCRIARATIPIDVYTPSIASLAARIARGRPSGDHDLN